MNTGKTRRLRRIMQQDNRTVIVPMDHGVTVGPIQGITNMQTITDKLVKGGVDAILVHKGIAKRVDTGNAGLIVMLSGMSNLSPNINAKVQVCSVQEAIRIGADAVSVHVNVGAQDEDKMLQNLGKVAEECDALRYTTACHDVSAWTKNPKRTCTRSGSARRKNRRRTWRRHNQNKLHRQHRNLQNSS